MNLLSSLRSFVSVINYQSFSGAARKLYISRTKLINQIAALEKYFHTKLLIRSTRRLILTESGRVLYEKAIKLINDVDQLQLISEAKLNEPEGWIRLCLTVTPAIPYLTELSLDFMRQFPKVQVYILEGSEIIGLHEDQYDLVISFDPITHPQLTCKKIFTVRRGVFASPKYLEEFGEPKVASDLNKHNCLVNTSYGLQNTWVLNKKVLQVAGNFKSNNANILKQAAVDGVGLIWVPPFTVFNEVKNGVLKQVLAKEVSHDIDLYAIYSRYLSHKNKVKLLLDFFQERAVKDNLVSIPTQT